MNPASPASTKKSHDGKSLFEGKWKNIWLTHGTSEFRDDFVVSQTQCAVRSEP